jgi:hypothetical protein
MTQIKETYIHTVVIKDTIEESLMDNILDKKVRIMTFLISSFLMILTYPNRMLYSRKS